MTAMETGWGLDLIIWFQSWRTPLIAAFGTIFHYLGSEQFYLVILPLIYWCLDAAFGRRLAIFFLLASWGNAWFKALLHRPRPADISEAVQPVVQETGFGTPSGHAQNAVSLWGLVAYHARRVYITAIVVVYVLLVMVSRMIVGVHYLHDVVIGALIGTLLVGVYVWAEPRLSRPLAQQKVGVKVGLVILATAILLAISIRPTSVPATVTGVGTSLGAFLGMGVGIALETSFVHFRADGPIWKRALRFVLGVAVMLILWQGLDVAFEGLEPELVFRLIRYGLVGLWGSFGAPWVFVRIRLAEVDV